MRLRIRFMLLLSAVIIASFGITFFRTSAFQKELVIAQAAQQARMLHKQIILTRQWIADHNGVLVAKAPGVESNPFLPAAEVVDRSGTHYVRRNPAMVTRELSEYANRDGFCRYRVTSLRPVNPANGPDGFERAGLLRFEQGVPEVVAIDQVGPQHFLRFMAPLIVSESCLECHARHGYRQGDIRGALSIAIPVDWAYDQVARNNRMLLGIATLTITLVSLAIYLLFDLLVGRRLNLLAQAMERYDGRDCTTVDTLPASADEVGILMTKFREFCHRFTASQEELDRTREQAFHSEKMAALGRLAAGVAHEINNPLGGMLNCVKAMQDAPDDVAMHQRYLELLRKGLHRIGATVRQLLNFGRREPLHPQPVAVDELIRECFQLLEYGLKRIDLELDLALPQSCLVDLEALKQIIINIGLNAIQAMPAGGSLRVRTESGDGRIRIEFTDSGPGIAPEHLDKIFDPFFTTKEVGEGTGLGLSVTHALVERMGGEITVASRPGSGARFTVILPIPPRAAAAPRNDEDDTGAAAPARG
ncbi:MAG: ATP-binding protein [Thermodesulfobacteriota bacterium]